jgi:hypothetical protein
MEQPKSNGVSSFKESMQWLGYTRISNKPMLNRVVPYMGASPKWMDYNGTPYGNG